MIVETKPGQRYKACNVCRKRKIGCDGDGIHPCGPCLRFNENKSARTATFKFVNEDGDVECTYHETRFDVPKYMNASQAKKRTVSEVEEGNEPSPGKEEAEQLIELEGKLEDLQSVLHRMTFQHVVREGTCLGRFEGAHRVILSIFITFVKQYFRWQFRRSRVSGW
ncbi:hypothetical protein BT69DRAFT_377858 [Atractiella rhizophila]|nr:hypothetical protein BT69DRAFT_377858 [Atractiella rhizophila]